MLIQDLLSWANRVKSAIPAPINKFLLPAVRPFAHGLEKALLRRLYATMVKPGDLVFDIGAHTGFMTDILTGLGARVVSVEPQPSCVDALKARFGRVETVSIEACGVGEQPGEMTFSICSEKPQLSTFSGRWIENGRFSNLKWDVNISVPVTTLDLLIERYGTPRFCKIDVEDFEISVLKGLSQRLDYVSFEFHIEAVNKITECMSLLENLGTTHFQVSLYTRQRFELPDWVTSKELVEFLVRHPGRDLCGDIYAKSSGHR